MAGETEAGARGREGLTRRIIEHGKEQGKPVSEQAARKMANEIAKRADVDKGLR
jgi:nicotinamide mononucleotide (NMN) deamidase PncC